MAGNLGNATQAYAFAVDATLPLPGSETAGWFSGWHKWAVIAGATAVGFLLLVGLSAVCFVRHRRERQVRGFEGLLSLTGWHASSDRIQHST